MDHNKENRAPNQLDEPRPVSAKEPTNTLQTEPKQTTDPRIEEIKQPVKSFRESANSLTLTPEKMRSSFLNPLRRPSNHFSPNGSSGSCKIRSRIAHSENKSDMKITPVKQMTPSSCYSVCSGNCEYYCMNSSPMEYSSGSNSFKKHRPHPHLDH